MNRLLIATMALACSGVAIANQVDPGVPSPPQLGEGQIVTAKGYDEDPNEQRAADQALRAFGIDKLYWESQVPAGMKIVWANCKETSGSFFFGDYWHRYEQRGVVVKIPLLGGGGPDQTGY